MTNKTDAWMPLWIGAYLADTMRLTTIQHGAYLLLLMAYWCDRSPLPDIDDELRSITKTDNSEWKAMRPVLAKFFRVEDGVWWHKRVEEELSASKKHKEKAESGGSSRWGSDSEERGRGLRSQRLSEARTKGTHSPAEWDAMKAFHGHRCVRCHGDGEIVKDHILPIYQGGSDSIENIQPLCRSCNCSKGPDASDLRSNGWRNAIADALKNACLEGIKRLPDASTTPSPSPISSSLRSEEAAAKPRLPRTKSRKVTLRQYLDQCKAEGTKPIPDDHPIRPYARDAGITDEMLQVTWTVFKENYLNSPDRTKVYVDWAHTFANAVKGCWQRIWITKPDGSVEWSSIGLQQKNAIEARLAREDKHAHA